LQAQENLSRDTADVGEATVPIQPNNLGEIAPRQSALIHE